MKSIQASNFDNSKLEIETDTVILQIDFAENFSLVSQDEIQSAHWNNESVTIFTACAWLSNGCKESMAIVSDELSHDKYSVWIFLKKIVQELKKKYPSLNKMKIYSDGCAAQFKNRYSLSNLIHMKTDVGFSADWTFFATSHGKGAVDGVGATLKRTAWNAIKSRRFTISSAKEFYNFVSQSIAGVIVVYVPKTEVGESKQLLNERWNSICSVSGIRSNHFFRVANEKSLEMALTCDSTSLLTKLFK